MKVQVVAIPNRINGETNGEESGVFSLVVTGPFDSKNEDYLRARTLIEKIGSVDALRAFEAGAKKVADSRED